MVVCMYVYVIYRETYKLFSYQTKISRGTVVHLNRNWEGLKWRHVLKVWEQLQDKHSEEMLNSYRLKPLPILMSNIAPESNDFSSQLRKSNAKISILFFFFFLLSFFFLVHQA